MSLDLSAFVDAFVFACLDWCEIGDCLCFVVCVSHMCLSECVLMQ